MAFLLIAEITNLSVYRLLTNHVRYCRPKVASATSEDLGDFGVMCAIATVCSVVPTFACLVDMLVSLFKQRRDATSK